MIPKKIYLNYVNEDDKEKTWSEEPVSVNDCDMQNREYTDLSQVWHDASEEPTVEQTHILATNETDIIEVFPLREGRKYNLNGYLMDWSRIVAYFNLTKWAYISDLLPKGCEK